MKPALCDWGCDGGARDCDAPAVGVRLSEDLLLPVCAAHLTDGPEPWGWRLAPDKLAATLRAEIEREVQAIIAAAHTLGVPHPLHRGATS